MSLRSRRFPELFVTERDRILKAIRAARNAVMEGHRGLKTDSPHYRAGSAVAKAMDDCAEALTGKPGALLDPGQRHFNTSRPDQPDR